MTFEPDSSDDIFTTLSSDLQAIEPEAYPNAETTLLYATLTSVSNTTATQEQDLKDVYDAAYVSTATGEDLDKKAQNFGFRRRDAVKATGVVTFKRDSNATSDYTIPSGTVVETISDTPVSFETIETVTLQSGTSEVDANVQAVDGGTQGNVATNAIQALPSKPTGVDSVINRNPTGDPTVTDTNDDPLIAGQDEETDPELRKRIFDTDATQAGPDASGVRLALQNTDGVISASLNTNQTSSTVDGIEPFNTEVIVYGGKTQNIAETLYEVMATSSLLRLQGGVNGTKDETTITSDFLKQEITVEITRPTRVGFDVSIDVVHRPEYQGDSQASDAIVEYVGGTFTDGSTTIGLETGENVLINEMENRVEDLPGVDYADITLVDTDGDGVDDTTTDSDGVPVLSISNSELGRLDAADITVNSTLRS